jgi:tRNA threonylcarbamoyladenosine biosynthesis protein TsaE
MSEQHRTRSAEETIALAHRFAASLERGSVAALYGELGAGKTQFVKGVCSAFHVRTPATSPSFVLLNRYAGRDSGGHELMIYHFDLYRMRSVVELYDIGYEEFFFGGGICLIEWADMMEELLPRRRSDIRFSLGAAENERVIEISGTPAR